MHAFITGAFDTEVGELPGSSCMGLHAQAAIGAVADAGLKLSDIDGVLCAYSFTEPHLMLASVFCEYMGIRTAFHGPGDVSPVGHAANMHLDLAIPNFGIQELSLFRDETREVFPGCPEVRDGCMWANDEPGLGIDVDERRAAMYPYPDHPTNGCWPEIRGLDGTIFRP